MSDIVNLPFQLLCLRVQDSDQDESFDKNSVYLSPLRYVNVIFVIVYKYFN